MLNVVIVRRTRGGLIVAQVSPRAWSELLHAEVAFLLRQVGVPTLHIKGPSVALWLYDEGERDWGDVDILVPPSRMEHALSTLLDAGFVERFPGVNRRTSTDHAITLAQTDPQDPGVLLSEVDVHDRFEGIGADPERAFDELWRRREPDELGHVEVWFPDLPTRALLVALNTARSDTPKARRDLTRLVASAGTEDWEDVIWLAKRVDALPGLRAGLEVDPAGVEVVAATELAGIPVSPEWALRRAGAPRTAVRLEELRRIPARQRPRVVARWIVPHPALIRMRDPAASGNVLRLTMGYARRYRDGMTSLVPTVKALASVFRSRSRDSEGAPVKELDS